MEVVPGIHKVDGTWGGNVYLMVDDEELALVDAALPFISGRILRYIRRLGRDPSELSHIVLTHAHPDHTGTIPDLLKSASIRVLVHPGDVKRDRDGRPRLFYPAQPVTTSWNVPFFGKIWPHGLVEEGDTLPIMGGLKVIHVPGHTPGSIAFHLEELGVLFTGDMLISDGKRFTRPFPFPGTDLKTYRRSVERLAELSFDVACVGHGRPLVGGAKVKVREMLDNYFWAASFWKLLRRLAPSH